MSKVKVHENEIILFYKDTMRIFGPKEIFFLKELDRLGSPGLTFHYNPPCRPIRASPLVYDALNV